MNPYYKLYVYFLGPKILTEIETLQAKLKKGAGDLGCALWVGRDRHPVRQLSTGHPSFRREPWKMINFSKGGAWCQMEERIVESSIERESESCHPL